MSAEEIREKLRKLEESFIEGRISEETYKELKAKYEAELAALGAPPARPAAAPPKGLGDLFSRAADFCTSNPLVFLPPVLSGIISAIIFLALGVSAFGMFRGFRPPIGPRGGYYPPTGIYGYLGLRALASIIVMIISLIFNGWTISMVKQGVEQNVIDLSSSLSYTLSKFVPLLIASILVGIIVGIGLLLCVIPGLIALILLALTLQAVIVDDYGAVESLSVSFNIVKRNFFEVLIIVIVQFVVAFILGSVPYIGSILAELAGAYFTVLLTLLYYGRRTPRSTITV
ncbi:MAG TPA: hypothetical protein ENG61_00670 [Candidatus Korarchaeota archaeon]|nr:hypothetical protein [Candidatus Korarchaeota archaeon]